MVGMTNGLPVSFIQRIDDSKYHRGHGALHPSRNNNAIYTNQLPTASKGKKRQAETPQPGAALRALNCCKAGFCAARQHACGPTDCMLAVGSIACSPFGPEHAQRYYNCRVSCPGKLGLPFCFIMGLNVAVWRDEKRKTTWVKNWSDIKFFQPFFRACHYSSECVSAFYAPGQKEKYSLGKGDCSICCTDYDHVVTKRRIPLIKGR